MYIYFTACECIIASILVLTDSSPCTVTVPRVHIKGLEDNGDKEELRRLFGKFGPLRNVWIATKPPGFAYVFFESFKDAEKACDYYNGKRVCGMNVRVELSPIEDKWRPRPLPPPRRLHPPDRRRHEEDDASFSDNSFYDSGSPSDYERRYDGKGSRGSGHYRDDYQRGRPHHRGGSRGGHHSQSRSYSDERRHHPERNSSFSRGRGYSDGRSRYNEGEYRPRVRSHDNYHSNSFRGRGPSRGVPSDRYHSSRGSKHYDRAGGLRPKEYHRQDPYSGDRGHYEKPHKRPNSSRHLGPPSRHPPDYPPTKRRLGPAVDSEYVAKQYRLKHSKNGEFGESSKSGESRHHDMEYRHSRKMAKEEIYRKSYDQEEPGRESYHRHSSGHRRSHHTHANYYKSKDMRSRSPLSSGDGYSSPHSRYYSRNNSPSASGSRSRSISNPTSDTSRGPSATPSPPPHPHHIPSRSPSRSASPMFPTEDRYSNEKYSHSPQEVPNYRTPSPEHVDTSKLTPSPPPPPPPAAPIQNPERVPSPVFVLSPVYVLPRQQDADFEEEFEDEQNIEMEEAKKRAEYKKIKREVRNQDRDRQISYQEKSSKHRYIDRHSDSRMIEDRDGKSLHSRPLSESFDMIGSSHSSEHMSPPPQQRRTRADLRRRSSHKEEYVVSKILCNLKKHLYKFLLQVSF